MAKTNIEWATHSWNPIVGCSKTSPGCDNCYAEKMAKRLAAMGHDKYKNVIDGNGCWNGNIEIDNTAIETYAPPKGSKIFVCSMGDLFHENVSFERIDKVLKKIFDHPEYTFILLTKRSKRMMEYFFKNEVPNNAWIGITICNQKEAEENIPRFLLINAKVKFISVEPMLGPVDLTQIPNGTDWTVTWNVLTGIPYDHDYDEEQPENRIDGINWVICGGESGSNARPMHPQWVRSLRDQCKLYNVPFLFKQWGCWSCFSENAHDDIDEIMAWKNKCKLHVKKSRYLNLNGGHGFHGEKVCFMVKQGKKRTGRLLDGVVHDEYPTV